MEQQEASNNQDQQGMPRPLPQLEPRTELYAKFGLTGFETKISTNEASALLKTGFLIVLCVICGVTFYLVKRDCTTNSGQRLRSGQKVQA